MDPKASVLPTTPQRLTKAKLQRVQNSFARAVCGLPYGASTRGLLRELHWLPVKQRITYKIASNTHRTCQSSQLVYLCDKLTNYQPARTLRPKYLAELISPHTSARELRSSSRRPNQLHVPNVKIVFGSRVFRHAAPAVWNGLPSEITDAALSLETFKSRLKTYLYSQSFRC